MRRNLIVLYLTILFLSVAGLPPAFGETPVMPPSCQPASLSLQQAIHVSLISNPMLSAARSRREASGDRVTQARSGLMPQVYFTQSFQRTTNPMWVLGTKLNQGVMTAGDFAPDLLNDPDAIDNFNSRFWFLWPLLDGPTIYGWRQADLGETASGEALERTRQETIARTVEAYADVLSARHQVTVIDQTIDTAAAHLKMIEKRFENGMVVKSDVLRAKVHLAELEQNRAIAKSAAAVARASLNTVMGEAADQELKLSTQLCKTKETLPELTELITTAVSQRPDLKQMDMEVKMASSEMNKAKAGHWPSLNLNGGYEYNSEDFHDANENYAIGADITVNLFSGGRITGQTREALNKLSEAKSQKQALLQQIRLETEKSYYDLLSADMRITTSELAVQNAGETLRIVSNRYDTGLLNIVSLLDAELALYRCNTNYYTALQDHVKARVRLALALGTLDENFR
ncbi:MAG: TolC family protein [Desulfosalsimonadaceae bacterium]|nr:TolC family protein [Desulfosalsimonadaceae bacterium]